jgi:hypothetical protein
VQTPFVHVCDPVHAVPALAPWQLPVAPQCPESVAGVTHALPQRSDGGSQTHAPSTQLWPVAHAFPPRQVGPLAPQRTWFMGHMHVPSSQTEPSPGQFCPTTVPVHGGLAPQYAWLLCGSTHPPPHSTRGAWQDPAHSPFAQTSDTAQAEPHPLQFCVLVMRSVHVADAPEPHTV